MEVVTTTPHSYCLPSDTEKNHKCDLSAKRVGEFFEKEMKSIDFPVTWFPSDTHRSIYDMNRKISRETPYRKSISEHIDSKLKSKDKEIWIIDLHSYPDSYSGFGDHEIVLLILKEEMDNLRTRILKKYLEASKINFGVYEASPENDIMKTSITAGAFSLLIEFNEKLSDSRLQNILSVIVSWIKEWSPEKFKLEK